METYSFGNICERDMDMLFLEAIISDQGFAKQIIDETELKDKDFKTVSVELSKSDAELGESDITWIIETDDGKYGILIEDKIDAIAMDNQCGRYKKRGDKGIRDGDYKKYFVFIFCSEKYHENNSEAAKYDHFISYEKHRDYFKNKSDVLSELRYQKLEQALVKAKKPSNVTLNENANAYFRNYSRYQKENYPTLDLRTKESSNGYWAHYGTRFGKVYLYHKIQEGFVDLTFPNSADKLSLMQTIALKLREFGMDSVVAEQTGKASALRIRVPKLDMQNEFKETAESNLIKCFDAIQKLTDLANVFEDARKIAAC